HSRTIIAQPGSTPSAGRPGWRQPEPGHENAGARPAFPARTVARRLLLLVALAELVDPAADIGRLLLARVERMRMAGDFHLDERVLLAVLPADRFLARHRRTGQEREIASDVLEHDRLVLRMDIGFH